MDSGDELRGARLRRVLTRAQLAKELGVSPKTIQRWEDSEELPERALAVAGPYFGANATDESPTLKQATEAELALELLARIEARRKGEAKDTGREFLDIRKAVTQVHPESDEHQRDA